VLLQVDDGLHDGLLHERAQAEKRLIQQQQLGCTTGHADGEHLLLAPLMTGLAGFQPRQVREELEDVGDGVLHLCAGLQVTGDPEVFQDAAFRNTGWRSRESTIPF